MYNRRHSISLVTGTIALALAVSVSCIKQVEAPAQPNLILIVTDDQGYADASFRGSPIKTPNIDRIVNEGAVLNRFYACPVCSPTRAGLMTGRYPVRFGMQRAVNRPFSTIGLPAGIKTLPGLLGEAGYKHRHMAGKWHLGNMRWEHLPLRQGFTSYYGPYNSGIDYFTHTRMRVHDWHRDDTTVFEEGYATDLLSDEVVKLIHGHKDSEDPFFIYLPHSSPHGPLMAPEEEIQKYRHLGEKKATYAAMVSIIDRGIGRILDALEETGKDRNTLVFFMSDNGGSFIASDNRPLRGGKGTLWEGGIRVLAAARWPGHIPPGTVIDEPCSYVDLLPTFLAAAGRPDLVKGDTLDGRNVLLLWCGEEWDDPGWEFFSFYEKYPENGGREELSLIRDNMKLIRWGKPILEASDPSEDATIELYDITSDTAESTNLAPEYPELVKEMLDRLRDYRSLRPAGGVPPMVEPVPEGWKPPENWDLARPADSKLTIQNFRESLRPEGFVMHDPDWYLWGASPVWDDDGKLHVYVSRWPEKYGFAGWRDVSEIAHYVADSPEGPFTYSDTPLKPTMQRGHWRGYCLHSATVSRIDNKWVMTFMAVAWHEGEEKIWPKNQANGLAFADSPYGPWKLAGNDGLILAPPADSLFWCYDAFNGVNNPTLIKTPDGRYLYYFKSMKYEPGKTGSEGFRTRNRFGIASSSRIEGPYYMHPEPVTSNKGLIEDGNAFMLNGKICILSTICYGDHDGGGEIYYSDDGIRFVEEPVLAYENILHYLDEWEDPAHQWGPWVLQVPRVLLGREGVPTHLFVPCGTAPEGEKTTGIFMFSLGPGKE